MQFITHGHPTLLKGIFTTFLLFAVLSQKLFASDVISIKPLTDKILMIHFDDGYVEYHTKGQERSDEEVIANPLSTTSATTASNYLISSTDDPNYSDGMNPIRIGRKVKGTEFTWLCENWGASGCENTSRDHAKEHWIYLYLPNALVSGKTYKVNITSIATNRSKWSFVFDETSIRSEAVHANIIGYSPRAPKKYAYVYHWLGQDGGLDLSEYKDNSFHVVDVNTGEKRYSGTINFRKSADNPETAQTGDTPNANFLGAEVYECDFSLFNEEGEYVVAVEGIGCSFPFRIEEDVYREPFYTTIRGLFHNRSGIELKSQHTDYVRKAPHNPLITPGFSGKLKYTTSRFIDWKDGNYSADDKPEIEAGILGSIDTWGWYQDAGDWDGYYTHLVIPSLLMFTYEFAPENFIDGELNIPESGNGQPDILDEASWLIKYFYRTRHELMDKDYGTGGVGGRVCGDHFGGEIDGQPSYEDVERTWIISGEDPHTTYKYAALAAQLAFCQKMAGVSDPDAIDWTTEAKEAFTWATNNTKSGDAGTKPAMPAPLNHFRMYAAASLYRLTEEIQYHDAFKLDVGNTISENSILENEKRWGPYVYALIPDTIDTDADLMQKITGAIIKTADFIGMENVDKRACRWGGHWEMPMLVGQGTTPWVFEAMIGYKVTLESMPEKAEVYLQNIFTTCDYFLGCNPLNMAWVTGLGERYPTRVFHIDSWYNGIEDREQMAHGIVPYGPWRDQDFGSQTGPWQVDWTYKTVHPNIDQWPGHERWFSNYTSPLNAEFTVHQNTVFAASVFGFLAGKADGSFSPNQLPGVSITSPKENDTFKEPPVDLNVDVSDPDGNNTISKVEYYANGSKIGESSQAPFSLKWEQLKGGQLKIRAKVFDKEGAWRWSEIVNITSEVVTGFDIRNDRDDLKLVLYPNPNNKNVNLRFAIHESVTMNLEIFTMNGVKVFELSKKLEQTGHQDIDFTIPVDIVQGIYLYTLNLESRSNHYNKTGKMSIY